MYRHKLSINNMNKNCSKQVERVNKNSKRLKRNYLIYKKIESNRQSNSTNRQSVSLQKKLLKNWNKTIKLLLTSNHQKLGNYLPNLMTDNRTTHTLTKQLQSTRKNLKVSTRQVNFSKTNFYKLKDKVLNFKPKGKTSHKNLIILTQKIIN